jgi:hypothetical protein
MLNQSDILGGHDIACIIGNFSAFLVLGDPARFADIRVQL